MRCFECGGKSKINTILMERWGLVFCFFSMSFFCEEAEVCWNWMSLLTERALQMRLSLSVILKTFFHRISEELHFFSRSLPLLQLCFQCGAFVFPPYYCERIGMEVATVWETAVRRWLLTPHDVPLLISSPWQLLGSVDCSGLQNTCIKQRFDSLCGQRTAIVLLFSSRLSAKVRLK